MLNLEALEKAFAHNIVLYPNNARKLPFHISQFNKIIKLSIDQGELPNIVEKGDKVLVLHVPEDYEVKYQPGLWERLVWGTLNINTSSLLNKDGVLRTDYFNMGGTLPHFRSPKEMALCMIETVKGNYILGALPYESK